MTIRCRDVDLPQPTRVRRSTASYTTPVQFDVLGARLQEASDAGDAAAFITTMKEVLRDPRHFHFRKSAGCPLHWVVAAGSPALLADYLRIQGFKDVSNRNTSGLTPLHLACAIGMPAAPALAAMLLAAGAPVNARDHHGRTPLHLAVGFPSPTINRTGTADLVALVATLMGEGADPDICDNTGGKASDRWTFLPPPPPEKDTLMPSQAALDDDCFDSISLVPVEAPLVRSGEACAMDASLPSSPRSHRRSP